MQFAGVDRGQVAALGPDTLLVLALPAWHGFLYSTHARWVGGKWVCTSQCCNAVFSRRQLFQACLIPGPIDLLPIPLRVAAGGRRGRRTALCACWARRWCSPCHRSWVSLPLDPTAFAAGQPPLDSHTPLTLCCTGTLLKLCTDGCPCLAPRSLPAPLLPCLPAVAKRTLRAAGSRQFQDCKAELLRQGLMLKARRT